MKNYKCEIYGVTLIRIKYDVQNLEEYIDKLIRMVTNNRELDMIEKHHKIESNLDKFM